LGEADTLQSLVEVAGEQGDPDQAAMYLHEAEAKYREIGRGTVLANGLNGLGYLALRSGNPTRARRMIEEALSLAREFGATTATANTLHSLGDVLRAIGDVAGAARQYREALVLSQDVHDAALATACFASLAGLAADTGRYQAAARLVGVVEALQETVGIPRSTYEEERLTEDMAAVREALGAETDAAARAAGQALTLETAVGEAFAFADELVRGDGDLGSPDSTAETS
jgi:tetratricopeptide (TPR) repeat protein